VIIVYTTIFGGSDSLKPAPVGADRCVCFVDNAAEYSGDAHGWELIPWAVSPMRGPRREAWHLRCIPGALFGHYSAVIWIDASFTLTDLPRLLRHSAGHDLSGLRHHKRSSCYEEGRELVRIGQSDPDAVATQLDAYRRAGFRPSALTISCILVRTERANLFNLRWDAEIGHTGDNTQLSIDYCAWKSGLVVHHLEGVRKENPYATHDHADHKRRRKPYR